MNIRERQVRLRVVMVSRYRNRWEKEGKEQCPRFSLFGVQLTLTAGCASKKLEFQYNSTEWRKKIFMMERTKLDG